MGRDALIPKKDLVHGQYYWGICRNASIARWDANKNCFFYNRHKFGDTFIEDINHPQDDNGFDLFKPLEEVTWGVDEIVLDN